MKKKISKRYPLVTVSITCKNYGKFLLKSLESVLCQSYKNIEIFVIDDNSEDGSKKILDKIKRKYPKISCIHNNKNLGLQKISNLIIKICKGNFFLRLDADDWLHKNTIKDMVKCFKIKKNIGAVYGNYYYANVLGKIIGYENNLNIIKKHIAPHGACTMYKVSDLKRVKGYYTDIKAQDGWDTWLKLRDTINYYHLNKPLFYYRQHQESLTKTKKNILKERGKIFKKVAKMSNNKNQKISLVVPIKNSFGALKNVPFKKIGNTSLIEKLTQTISKLDGNFDIIFTTSNMRVINYLNKYKKKNNHKKIYIFKRPAKFEKSISSLQDILNFSKNEYRKKLGNSKIFLFLNLHIVRNKIDHLLSAINLMKISNFDIIFSVFREKEPIFKFQKKEFTLLNAGRFNNLDFNSETIYKFNGSVICGKWGILEKGNMFKKKSGFVETDQNEILNINDLDKFK